MREIFEKVAQGMFQDRQGGYTSHHEAGSPQGRRRPMVIMELVTEPVKAKDEEARCQEGCEEGRPKKVENEAKAEETKVEAEEAKAEEAADQAEEAAAENAEAAEAEAVEKEKAE